MRNTTSRSGAVIGAAPNVRSNSARKILGIMTEDCRVDIGSLVTDWVKMKENLLRISSTFSDEVLGKIAILWCWSDRDGNGPVGAEVFSLSDLGRTNGDEFHELEHLKSSFKPEREHKDFVRQRFGDYVKRQENMDSLCERLTTDEKVFSLAEWLSQELPSSLAGV